jgi:hypothetical protein
LDKGDEGKEGQRGQREQRRQRDKGDKEDRGENANFFGVLRVFTHLWIKNLHLWGLLTGKKVPNCGHPAIRLDIQPR